MKLPQFTLRDLFWLVLVCALAVGWWMQSRELARLRVENGDLHEYEERSAALFRGYERAIRKHVPYDYFWDYNDKTHEYELKELD